MPRPQTRFAPTQAEVRIGRCSAEPNERDDCSVRAVALVAGVHYDVAHGALTAAGRPPRGKSHITQIYAALTALGVKFRATYGLDFIERYPGAHKRLKSVTTHHPERFPAAWAGVTALIFTRGHVSAVVNGHLADWARGRALRAWKILVIETDQK